MDLHKIAGVLHCPAENVAANWPTVRAALESVGLDAQPVLVAALATIAVECPSFAPRTEQYNGDPAVFFSRYDGRKDLGNVQMGDGFRFRGRGFIQITGRANYARYGALLGADLTANPSAVLEPSTAAAVFAAFFYEQGIGPKAMRGDWRAVRRAVNGGLNGYDDFIRYVAALTPLVT